MNRALSKVSLLILVVGLSSCHDDARAIWQKGVRKCANNDLLGRDVLFFGPSNKHGPGTVFQVFASDKAVQVSHLPAEYLPPSIIFTNGEFTCSSESTNFTKIGASLDLSKLLSTPAEVSGSFQKASSITVQADRLQWIELVTGPFRSNVFALPAENMVKKDLLSNGHVVLSRALRVQGMRAELNYAKDAAAAVKATLPQTITGVADTGISLTANWVSDTKLVLSSQTDFYIAGELRHVREFGLAADTLGELVSGTSRLQLRR